MRYSDSTIACIVLREASYRPGPWLLSDRHHSLVLVCDDNDPMLEFATERPEMDLPILQLVRRPGLADGERLHAQPITPNDFAFGGNWLWSSDARFPADHPIKIHDSPRTEPVR